MTAHKNEYDNKQKYYNAPGVIAIVIHICYLILLFLL